MDWTTIIFATYEIVLSVVFSLLTVYITKITIDRFLFKVTNHQQGFKENIAAAIFSGTLIICVLILVNSSILPAVDTLRTMAMASEIVTFRMVGLSFLYFLLYFSITVFFSIVIIFLAIGIIFKATVKVDEIKEILDKNIAVAVIISMAILGITLFVRPSLNRFVSSLINYEQLEQSAFEHEKPSDEAEEGEQQYQVPLKPIEPK